MFDNKVLRELAEKSQISYNQTAEALGMSEATFKSYLRKTSPTQPSLDNLIKLADFYAVPLDVIVGRCTAEQYRDIMSDYSQKFHQLRSGNYADEATDRRALGETRISQTNKDVDIWPYNLLAKLFKDPVDWQPSQGALKRLEETLDAVPYGNEVREYFKEGLSRKELAKRYDVTTETIICHIGKALGVLRRPNVRNYFIKDWQICEDKMAYFEAKEKALEEKAEKIGKQFTQLMEKEAEVRNKNLETSGIISIDELDLTPRSYCCLKRAGINTVEEVVEMVTNDTLIDVKLITPRIYKNILQSLDSFLGTRYYKDENKSSHELKGE